MLARRRPTVCRRISAGGVAELPSLGLVDTGKCNDN